MTLGGNYYSTTLGGNYSVTLRGNNYFVPLGGNNYSVNITLRDHKKYLALLLFNILTVVCSPS